LPGSRYSKKINKLIDYSVLIKKSAIKELEGLPAKVFDIIDRRITSLGVDPRPSGVKKLIGEKNLYRIRYRSYRIIYTIDDLLKTITILKIKHRREAY
jgi:mRNA interferase RelE/StbE